MKRIHFIGLGGIGMSGIARIHLERGDKVQGSDVKKGPILEALEARGVKVFVGHDAAFVKGADIVVYSSAVPADHPERVEAVRLGIPVIHRADALEALCRGKATIAVSGTHGKTTTTAMIGSILKDAKRDPTVVVGGWVEALGGNAVVGQGAEAVIEADESDASFLKFSPAIAVITNIEAEHLDHYPSIRHIEDAFEKFLERLVPHGKWFGCVDDPRVRTLMEKRPHGTGYGFTRTKGLWAENITECPDGRRGIAFDARHGEALLGRVSLIIPGRHNVLNALAAIGVAHALHVPFKTIASALGRYAGAGRRFDVKYEDPDYLVVDDYAHHPTEIEKTLSAARSLKKGRIVALFQPHRFSRTELLMKEFAQSFAAADKLILTDIYAASEAPRPGITGQVLFETVKNGGHPDVSFAPRESLADAVRGSIRPGDLVLVMGAGDITQVASQLSECLRKNGSLAEIFSGIKGKVRREEPLSKHTSLRIGGAAEFWIEPDDEADLQKVLQIAGSHGLRVTVFGAGSNLLAPDQGLRGVALHLGSVYFKEMRMEGNEWVARAGVPNSLFIQYGVDQGLGGFEFLSGIPGNIGGALAMNAGSHNQAVAPFVKSVRTMDASGQVHVRAASGIPFTYRHCGLKNEIFLEACFIFPKTPRADVQRKLDSYRDHRMETQDLQRPSAGCMFKNPQAPGCSAGRLIDEAGLKGLTEGGAQISPKHANFIVNAGQATASDVRRLIEKARAAVKEKHGIDLETEVKILT